MSTKNKSYWKDLVHEALNSRSERNDLDFKSSLSDDNDRLKDHINAFGNTQGGGAFVLGVTRSYEFNTGAFEPEKVIKQIGNLATASQSPALQITPHTIQVQGNDLLLVHVHEGATQPVFIKDRSPWGGQGCFKRSGTSTVPMTDDEIRDRLSRSRPIGVDESIVPDIGLADLDLERIARTFTGISPDASASAKNLSILLDNNILIGDADRQQVSLAGFLIFGRSPQSIRQFRNAHIEFQVFRGTTRADPIKKSTIMGALPDQIDNALQLCMQHVWTMPQIKGARREDIPAYDVVMLREVITNAVAHRDYSKMHQPVKIGVFTDRIELENPGTLMPGLTIYNMVHKRAWRNQILARLLEQCGYGEMDGQGIDRLYAGTIRIRLPAPRFVSDEYGFKVILSGPKRYEDLSPDDRRLTVLILLVLENSVDNELVRTTFNIESSQAGTLLKAMVADGLIEQAGPSRKFAKYCLSKQFRERFFD